MHSRYQQCFAKHLSQLRQQGRYREFMNISRTAGAFPQASLQQLHNRQEVTVWCSNDYLSMGQHAKVHSAVQLALAQVGAGAGGTRNIAGTSHYHIELEELLADWYHKPAALIFSSGYIANQATLGTLGKMLPNAIFLSDAENHASMIAGIKDSGADKQIFRHNDIEHLEELLQALPLSQPKIIAFESVYSMSGDFAPIAEICALAKRYQAITYLDEVHGVGLYGETGSGLAEQQQAREHVDIIQGTFGKAIGLVGGYITGNKATVDLIRSFAGPFIFTTAIPPMIAAGAIASIKHLQASPALRTKHQAKAKRLKAMLRAANLPILNSPSHIVPLMIRHAACCKRSADVLLQDYNIYVQPINYPTVPEGSERFRLTPGLHHSEEMMQHLVTALKQVWKVHSIEQYAEVC